jgi:hypothetical protein
LVSGSRSGEAVAPVFARFARCALRLLAVVPLVLAACESNRPATMIVPGQVRRALANLSDLSATAELVSSDGARQPAVALERAADGVSFSGFIAAAPGEYQLEVVFKGVPAGRVESIFLGRWTSDGFSIRTGASANPAFSAALDTIGRPEDGGDPDQDGFGNLDEIIWGTDPNSGDSDDDGVLDGVDCAPDDATNTFVIIDGGSIEDCDGDGVARPDVPFGNGGNDCNDRDATIRPGAEDDCSDGLDQDCNPSTCPTNDVTAPMIGALQPPDGSTVGCHTRVRAEITDDGNVAASYVYLEEPVPGTPLSLYMTRGEGDEFVAPPFNDYVNFADGLLAGTHAIELRAQDNGGNMTEQSMTYEFAFDLPQITSMTPAEIGIQNAPFTIDVRASAPRGVALLQLMAVKRSGGGTYNTAVAVELGRSQGDVGSFTIDPASLEDGEYLLYPLVTDPIGNELRPYQYPSPTGGPNGLGVAADFRCIAMPSYPMMPARLLIVGGQNAYAPVKMRELLPEALSLASATNPNAQLISIIGFGIRADGTVGLDDASSYIKRWTFGFWDPIARTGLSVAWYTPAFTTTNPVVDADDGSISESEVIADPGALVDSDGVVAAYSQAGCPQVAGTDDDWILYQFVDGQAVVSIYNQAGSNWRGTATAPITQIFACN